MFSSNLVLALTATAATVYASPCSNRTSSGHTSGGAAPYGTLNSNTSASASSSTAASSSGAVQCPVVLDGRVPTSLTAADFNTDNGIFNPDYVHGNNLTWGDILLFPEDVANSRFDNSSYKSLEVTINDLSIFQQQTGFRRAGLQFVDDANENSTGYVGVKTLHWSVKQDEARALNLSHEYLNVWHEQADYSADQIMFQTGKMIDYPDMAEDTFKIFDRDFTLLYETAIDYSEWQNFAVTMDIDANTVQIYYSLGNAALEAVTDVLSADLSGMGQYQIGILKKPTGTTEVTTSGYQESGLNEGQIYGGLFVEDSTDGCISL